MSQNYSYPSSSQVTITGIGNPNGAPIPADSVLIGAENPSGNLEPLQTDVSGNLLVSNSPIGTQDTNLTKVGGTAISLGQKVSASSLPVVLASDQSSIVTTIRDSSGNALTSTGNALDVNLKTSSITLTVSGTVTANQGTSPWVDNISQFGGSAVVTGIGASGAGIPRVSLSNDSVLAANQSMNLSQVAGATTATGHGTASGALRVELPTDGTGLVNVAQSTAANLNATVVQSTASNLKASVNLNDGAGSAVNKGQTTASGSLPVVLASDQSSIPVANTPASSATATLSNVASSASSVTLLSSNAARKGATIFNDSTAVVYVKFGTTASNSSYTVQIASLGYYELPFTGQGIYTGRIDAIWASADGNARVTELT